MPEGKIQHGTADEEPGADLREEERERQQRYPAESLCPASGKEEPVRVAEMLDEFDGCQLCDDSNELRQGRQDADMQRCRM